MLNHLLPFIQPKRTKLNVCYTCTLSTVNHLVLLVIITLQKLPYLFCCRFVKNLAGPVATWQVALSFAFKAPNSSFQLVLLQIQLVSVNIYLFMSCLIVLLQFILSLPEFSQFSWDLASGAWQVVRCKVHRESQRGHV